MALFHQDMVGNDHAGLAMGDLLVPLKEAESVICPSAKLGRRCAGMEGAGEVIHRDGRCCSDRQRDESCCETENPGFKGGGGFRCYLT